MRAIAVLSNEWPFSGGFAQYARWAQQQPQPPQACGEGGAAAAAAGRPNASTPAAAAAAWRARGGEDLPYPGPGGQSSWVDWMRAAGAFYTSPAAVAAWSAHAAFTVGRTNRYTGAANRDDPTVLAWEVANEPRARGGPAAVPAADVPPFRAFVAAAAALLARAAPRQLVAAGCEGDTQLPSLGQAALLSMADANVSLATAHGAFVRLTRGGGETDSEGAAAGLAR